MDQAQQPTLEYRFRESDRHTRFDIPSWANRSQREKFEESGLVIWNHETKTVTRLSGTYLLGLYDEIKTDDTWWRQAGVTVGTPVTRILIDHPDEAPREVLTDEILSDGQQAEEIFGLLENKMEIIQQLAAAEEKKTGERWRGK